MENKLSNNTAKFYGENNRLPKVTIRANCESASRPTLLYQYAFIAPTDLCTAANSSKKDGAYAFVKLIGEKRARENPAGLIVNCKQFRNCVDKAIKPFDRPYTGAGEGGGGGEGEALRDKYIG